MTIETTINGGLPVVASAKVQTDGDDINMDEMWRTLEIYFKKSRHECASVEFEDQDRIINELIEAQEEEWAREGVNDGMATD